MPKSILLSADIHLSHNPDHEYRWGAMEKLAQHASREDIIAVVIAGDLIDAKDRHPAAFVNRVVDSVRKIADTGKMVYILKGNHDYIEATCAFFKFLQELDWVTYVDEPMSIRIDRRAILFVPHVKSWAAQAGWRREFKFDQQASGDPWDLIICHQTFGGAQASNGFELEGVPLATVSKKNTGGAQVIAGDIHVPQTIGNVTYIGSPHPVAFGDTFEPGFGVWELDTETFSRIKRTTLRRLVMNCRWDDGLSVEVMDDTFIPREGDHVKFRYHGDRSEAADWPEIRRRYMREAERVGFRLFGTEFVTKKDEMPATKRNTFDEDDDAPESDDQEFELFCREAEVPAAYMKLGRELLG